MKTKNISTPPHTRPGRIGTLADIARTTAPAQPARVNCAWCSHPNSTNAIHCTKCGRKFD